MQLTFDRYGPLTIFRLAGRMDMSTCTAITPQIERELPGVEALAIDMSRVEFMSSAGLRFLLLLQRRLQVLGVKEWGIVEVPEAVADTLRVTGFADLLRFSELTEVQIRDRIDAGDRPFVPSAGEAPAADGGG